jgi:hypothetical protein
MTVDEWLREALRDARRRGRPELVPLLEGLAKNTRALRDADWNLRTDETAPTPQTDVH